MQSRAIQVKNPWYEERKNNPNYYTVNISPQYMTGDKNAVKNIARDLKPELDLLTSRYGG